MPEAIESRPFCEAVAVTVHDDCVADAIDRKDGYTELTGPLIDVETRIEYEVVTSSRRPATDRYRPMELLPVEK